MILLVAAFVFLGFFVICAVVVGAPLVTARFLGWQIRTKNLLRFVAVSAGFSAAILSFVYLRSAKSEIAGNLDEIRRLGCVRIEGTSRELLSEQFKTPFEAGVYRVLFGDPVMEQKESARKLLRLVKEGPDPSRNVRSIQESIVAQLPATDCPFTGSQQNR